MFVIVSHGTFNASSDSTPVLALGVRLLSETIASSLWRLAELEERSVAVSDFTALLLALGFSRGAPKMSIKPVTHATVLPIVPHSNTLTS